VASALLALVALLTTAACGSPNPQAAPATVAAPPSPSASPMPSPPTSPGGDPTAPACGPQQRPPLQEGGHVIGDTAPPVPYSSTPPTSGWHASGLVEIGVQPPDRPLSEPEQVAVLEAGAVVVSHRGLPEAERVELEALIARHFPRRAAVTPYDRLQEGRVALAAWGVLQICDRFDPAAVTAFVAQHASETPSGH
jgi:hypothetical protein